MWKWTPLYRSPAQLQALENFFVKDDLKAHILAGMATGFVSHFEYPPPEPWGTVNNYPLLTTAEGRLKFRQAMKAQVLQGRMIGGEGWTNKHVKDFFGDKNFYGIPSNGVMKDGDPCGRIVHDYGYYPKFSYSVNAAHSCTSVRYLTTKEVVSILDSVT